MKESNKAIIEHLPDFLDYLDVEKGLADKSQEDYSRYLSRFFAWLEDNHLSKLMPHQLDSKHIWDYRVHLARHTSEKTNKSLKKSTQNYYLIALRGLLNYFVARDIRSLPAETIELAKNSREKRVNFLNTEQMERLLLSPDTTTKTGLRDRAILETLYSTGMRVAELAALDRRQVRIKDGVKDLEIAIVGKGDRPRTVYFSERAVRWLKKYLDQRMDVDPALFVAYKKGSGDNDSRRLRVRSIERLVKKYVLKAGLPVTTTPHTIRHSYATDLLRQGADLRSVQELLGHKNIITTQIYTHVTNKQLRDIHRKFHSGKELKE